MHDFVCEQGLPVYSKLVPLDLAYIHGPLSLARTQHLFSLFSSMYNLPLRWYGEQSVIYVRIDILISV